MTDADIALAASAGTPSPIGVEGEYVPGVCNIGPAEIASRRRAGHTGVISAVALLAILVAVDAPPITRLLIFLPVAVGASGYLQAYLKFCAGFGSRGILNFGEVGTTQHVPDAPSRALDRAKANRIMLASFGIGIAVAVVAVVLPV